MKRERKTAIVIGLLFLLSTSTFLIGDELIGAIAYDTLYLEKSYPNSKQLAFGTFLQLINDIAVVSIGIMFLPILLRFNQRIAFAYMGSRIIEGVLLLVSSASLLSIIPLSEAYLKAATPDFTYFDTLGILFKSARYSTFQFAMVALGLGSLLLCYLLYTTKLIPRMLTVLGFLGYGSLLIKMFSEILGYDFEGEVLYLPGALFELLMPLWLIVKGFKLPSNSLESQSNNPELK